MIQQFLMVFAEDKYGKRCPAAWPNGMLFRTPMAHLDNYVKHVATCHDVDYEYNRFCEAYRVGLNVRAAMQVIERGLP